MTLHTYWTKKNRSIIQMLRELRRAVETKNRTRKFSYRGAPIYVIEEVETANHDIGCPWCRKSGDNIKFLPATNALLEAKCWDCKREFAVTVDKTVNV